MTDYFGQAGYAVRFDWGPRGAANLGPSSACLVVVDVLSFTTSVSVAVEAGTRVLPYPFRDATAATYAAQHGAALAVGRREVSASSPWSLSPATLRRAPFTERLVLPSPNGSAIAAATAGLIVAGCLRNAAAVGRWLAAQGFGTAGRPVAVIAAGEKWPDGSLRPALEDLLGAGAILHALGGSRSPEAEAAVACFEHTADVAAAVQDCGSGRELRDGGYAEDVAIAAALDATDVVPVRAGEAFEPA